MVRDAREHRQVLTATLKKISDTYDRLLSSKKESKCTIYKLNATPSLVMDEAVANKLAKTQPNLGGRRTAGRQERRRLFGPIDSSAADHALQEKSSGAPAVGVAAA